MGYQNDRIIQISDYIENPISLEPYESNEIFGSKCNGCTSCGGGCYGCKVTAEMLESKLKDSA